MARKPSKKALELRADITRTLRLFNGPLSLVLVCEAMGVTPNHRGKWSKRASAHRIAIGEQLQALKRAGVTEYVLRHKVRGAFVQGWRLTRAARRGRPRLLDKVADAQRRTPARPYPARPNASGTVHVVPPEAVEVKIGEVVLEGSPEGFLVVGEPKGGKSYAQIAEFDPGPRQGIPVVGLVENPCADPACPGDHGKPSTSALEVTPQELAIMSGQTFASSTETIIERDINPENALGAADAMTPPGPGEYDVETYSIASGDLTPLGVTSSSAVEP